MKGKDLKQSISPLGGDMYNGTVYRGKKEQKAFMYELGRASLLAQTVKNPL